jgi:hypothetical protein
MPRRFQIPKRLYAPATLDMTTRVIEGEVLTDLLGQFTSVEDFVAIQQSTNVLYTCGFGQGPLDLVLSVHAASVPDAGGNVQQLFTGKGQG